jgi:hypothetical protein
MCSGYRGESAPPYATSTWCPMWYLSPTSISPPQRQHCVGSTTLRRAFSLRRSDWFVLWYLLMVTVCLRLRHPTLILKAKIDGQG